MLIPKYPLVVLKSGLLGDSKKKKARFFCWGVSASFWGGGFFFNILGCNGGVPLDFLLTAN